ncbi:hypothetical protein M5689_024824 [Euphorbia peplus]|nr:hypothetical protein M5689_024824 [Euphorbia peplus]
MTPATETVRVDVAMAEMNEKLGLYKFDSRKVEVQRGRGRAKKRKGKRENYGDRRRWLAWWLLQRHSDCKW